MVVGNDAFLQRPRDDLLGETGEKTSSTLRERGGLWGRHSKRSWHTMPPCVPRTRTLRRAVAGTTQLQDSRNRNTLAVFTISRCGCVTDTRDSWTQCGMACLTTHNTNPAGGHAPQHVPSAARGTYQQERAVTWCLFALLQLHAGTVLQRGRQARRQQLAQLRCMRPVQRLRTATGARSVE